MRREARKVRLAEGQRPLHRLQQRRRVALQHAQRHRPQAGGLPEFVPLPFVHMEAPMWLQGRARSGPTFGESLAHARRRAAGAPPRGSTNVQALVGEGSARRARIAAALRAGVNDLGGTLMNESISRCRRVRAAGRSCRPSAMEALIRASRPRPAPAAERRCTRDRAGRAGRAASFAARPARRAAQPAGPRCRPQGAAPARSAGPARARSLKGHCSLPPDRCRRGGLLGTHRHTRFSRS